MRLEYIQSAVQSVTELIEPVLEAMDVELVDVEYRFEQGRWVLRIYADIQGGISVDDCARVSREIEDLIEVNDIFQQEYVLEVSSPGLNRPLKKEKDFVRVKGEKIKVRMRTALKGRRNFTGYLTDVRDGIAYVDVTEGRVALPLDEMEKANLVYAFGE